MRVGHLAIILDHVDPDLLIYVPAHGRAEHLSGIARRIKIHDPDTFPPYPPIRPAHLVLDNLGAERRGWWEPEPAFRLDGPFLRRALLEERLGWR